MHNFADQAYHSDQRNMLDALRCITTLMVHMYQLSENLLNSHSAKYGGKMGGDTDVCELAPHRTVQQHSEPEAY